MVQGVEARRAAKHFPRHFPRHRAALPAENPQPPVALGLTGHLHEPRLHQLFAEISRMTPSLRG